MASTARELLTIVGFEGEGLDLALGVSFAESDGYIDAVGDFTLVTAKWGPSVGIFQVRTLRDPNAFGTADRVRDIAKLRDPVWQAYAAYVLSAKGTNWQPWSVANPANVDAYAKFQAAKGKDYPLITGHREADRWNLQGYSIRDIDPLKAQVKALEAKIAQGVAQIDAAKAVLS